MALEQAACYINRCHIGFSAFLKDFEKFSKHDLSWGKRDLMNYPPAVPTTLQMIEELLNPQELSILRLGSFFSSEPIPVSIFEKRPEKIREAAWLLRREKRIEPQSFGDGGKLYIRELLSELASWSLTHLGGDSFRMHRLVQEFFLRDIPGDKHNLWAELALYLIDDYVCKARRPDDVRGWPFWDSMESHMRAAVSLADDYDIYEPTSRLMNELGLYLKSRERFSEAELLYIWALEINKRWYGPYHPTVAIRLNSLAGLYEDTKRLGQAEPLVRRAIRIFEENECCPPGCYTAALNNLAQVMKAIHRLDEAEPLMRRALEIDEEFFGSNHPSVAVVLNNLTGLLQETNRIRKARSLMRGALRIFKDSLGPEHPKSKVVQRNLEVLK